MMDVHLPRGQTAEYKRSSPEMNICRAPSRGVSFVVCVAVAASMLLQTACGWGQMGEPITRQIANERANSTGPVKRTFGLHIHDPINHWPTVPFGAWRLWDATVDWAHIEQTRGVYDFTRLDQYVALAEKHHVELIYVMGNTPSWSATDPTSASNELIPGANSPPTDLRDWQDYVRTVVTRYKGRIQAYEIWNEANLTGYWTGSLETMLQMTQMAYATIKQIDPKATVLAPSVVGRTAVDWSNKFLASGGAGYTDGIPYHLYHTSKSPESITQYYRDALALGQKWGKPVWDTEVGWGPWGTFDETQSASFLARTLILQSAAGLTQIAWYAWDDRGGWVHLYLVQSDMRTPTFAGQAFGEIQSWLANVAIDCSSQAGTWQCTLQAPDGTTRYIVWNPDLPQSFTIPSGWQVNRVRDLRSQVKSISGNTLQISSLPLLLEP